MAATKILYGLEQALRELLGKVAEDYGLDYAEMEQRYFGAGDTEAFPESIASSPPPPVHRTAVHPKPLAKATAGPLCTGKTTKGAPCKKKALAGGCFCAVHRPKEAAAGTPPLAPKKAAAKKASPVVSESPPPAPKKAKKDKAKAVEHSGHGVGEEREGCEGCEVHGDVEERTSPEYEVRGSVRSRMMEMLSRVAAIEDDVVDEE